MNYVIVETMPEQHIDSHEAAGCWGNYPGNGAERAVVARDDADEICAEDEHGYAHVIEIPASASWRIEVDDGEPEALDEDDTRWVVSRHTLVVEVSGITYTVATWTRCAAGSWRGGRWHVSEDTNGGDTLPEHIAELLAEIGLEDEYPDVPEPGDVEPDEDPDGEFAVYWDTAGDDAHVVARYADRADAESVAAQKQRRLEAAHPGGLLCGYEVRVMDDGVWTRSDRF